MWKKFFNLNTKILILIGTTAIIIFATAITYISLNSKNMAFKDAKKITNSYAKEYANLIKSNIDIDIGASRVLSYSFLDYKKIPIENRNVIYTDILKNTFIENPKYLAVWASFELSAYGEEGYNKSYGRNRIEVFSLNNKIKINKEKLNLESDDIKSLYFKIKSAKEEVVTEPYWYSYTKSSEDAILEASICSPILEEGKFIGLAGVDVPLDKFQKLTDKISPYDGSYAFLVSNNGVFVAHPNKKIIGKKISDIHSKLDDNFNILEKIEEGKTFHFISNILKENDEDNYYSFAPIFFGKSLSPWSIGISVPVEKIIEEANNNFKTSIWIGIIGLLILSIVVWLIAQYITEPLMKTSKTVKKLAKGDIKYVKKMSVNSNDEIGEIRDSVNILITSLKSTAKFAKQIGKGNLTSKFKLLSKKDVLGNALLNMRSSLISAKKEEEKRKEDDNKRNWATSGIAKFNEILRRNNDNIKELSYEVISNLVRYLGANQGGLFVINSEKEEKYIELVASFAYDRKKFIEKYILKGEGLIGRSVQEKETIYMTNIPQTYIEVTSGLGKNTPSSLLIVPLKLNDNVFGVVEVASFDEFEDYKVKFLEKIGESIASTISAVKISIRTSKLLEATKRQSEVLASQEEEMRQNLEELQATQEESARKEHEMSGRIQAINRSFIQMELDMKGNILQANDQFFKLIAYSKYEMLGKPYEMFINQIYSQSEEYKNLWNKLMSGDFVSGEFQLDNKLGKIIYLRGSFNPISDMNGKLYKIIQLASDVTNEVNFQKKLKIKNL